MDRPRPLPRPLPGALHGVGIVLPGTLEIPLFEPDAFSVPQVYRRKDGKVRHRLRAQERKFSYSISPARLLFSG